MGRIKIPYVERDGILYPVLTIPKDMELSAVGKYGLLWLSYMKENHKQRYRTLARLGCINSQAHEVNEEVYGMLDSIMNRYLASHKPKDTNSTMEMWKLREQAKSIAEEVVLSDIVYQYH